MSVVFMHGGANWFSLSSLFCCPFIDDIDDFKSDKSDPVDINKLSIRVQRLRSSPQSQVVLRLQKLAKIYEESARVRRRIKFIHEKLEENEQKNRFEQATIELLK